MNEIEKLSRQASWDEYRRKLMADRTRLRMEAAMAGEDEPHWLVDPPLVVPAWWKRPEGQVTLHNAMPAPKPEPIVNGRNPLGQVVKGHEPEPLLTPEQQFAIAEGRAREERLRKIGERFKEVLTNKGGG